MGAACEEYSEKWGWIDVSVGLLLQDSFLSVSISLSVSSEAEWWNQNKLFIKETILINSEGIIYRYFMKSSFFPRRVFSDDNYTVLSNMLPTRTPNVSESAQHTSAVIITEVRSNRINRWKCERWIFGSEIWWNPDVKVCLVKNRWRL